MPVVGSAWGLLVACSGGSGRHTDTPRYVSSGRFTPAHATMSALVKDFFEYYPADVHQPVRFNHRVHLDHGMHCVDCHKGVDQGPEAAIPSVQFCMMCHQVIATDQPEIKKVAAYLKAREEIPWQRVFWYYPSAHVKFAHAPHIRAGVSCSTCHGDMRQQTVAVRKSGLDMGFCLRCHEARHASTDCTVCHF